MIEHNHGAIMPCDHLLFLFGATNSYCFADPNETLFGATKSLICFAGPGRRNFSCMFSSPVIENGLIKRTVTYSG